MLLSKTDYIYLGVFLQNVSILSKYYTSANSIIATLGGIIYLYGLYLNRKHIIVKKYPICYKILLIAVLLMWIRFDINGYNAGTIQSLNGTFSTSLFLLFLYSPRIFKIEEMKKWAIISSLCGICFIIINWNYLLAEKAFAYGYRENEHGSYMATESIYLLMSCAFFLFYTDYKINKFTIYCIIIIFFAIITGMAAGRRGYTVLNLLFLLQFAFFYLTYSNSNSSITKRVLLISGIILFAYLYYQEYKDTQLSMFFNRLDTDSRSDIFYYWDKEMEKDSSYWIWGKGASGGYYDGEFGFIRGGIENGFRNMVLKGGLIYYLSYVILMFTMIYKSLKLNDRKLRNLSLYILLLYIHMFIQGMPTFSFLHLFMWISYNWIFDKKSCIAEPKIS